MKGDTAVTEALDTAEWVGIPSIVIGELWAGFLRGHRVKRNESELNAFLAVPVVEEVSVNRHTARIYAEILVGLRRAGTPLPTNDIWIAACAAETGATVPTYDEHFLSIPRVGCVLLSP